ncbi:MAG: SWIM zinc finger family protein [Chloroflexota bacterium]|nr:SWIM zinc finger family protein [Chloroflexota bacterium]
MAQFSRTWWGQRFIEALEQFTDPSRLGRGRSYASGGRILDYTLANGTVAARVRGSINPYFGVYKEPIYKTSITIKAISAADWTKVIQQIASRADLVTKLLLNEMPDTIEEAFSRLDLHLLPHSQRDFVTECSCPDYANPCKHIAGVYYLLASALDQDPFVMFELRGLSRDALHAELARSPLGQILASALVANDVALEVEPVESYYTRPTREPAAVEGTSSAVAGTSSAGTNSSSSKKRTSPGKKSTAASKKGTATGASGTSSNTSGTSHKEFWTGAKRPPAPPAASQASVPALLIKKQGDYPPFWHKDLSFISVMEELYERVRMKNRQMK